MAYQITYYSQNDPVCQNVLYTPHMTYGEGGCGAASVACIVKQPVITVGKYLTSIGKVADGQGTEWDGIPLACKHFGFNCIQLNTSSVYGYAGSSAEQQWLSAMKSGKYIGILLMGNSFFCNYGHYIVAESVDANNRCKVHDVAFSPRSGTYGWTQLATPSNSQGGANYYVPFFSGRVKVFYLIEIPNSGANAITSTTSSTSGTQVTTDNTKYTVTLPTIYSGVKGDRETKAIKLLQRILKARGYYKMDIDGLFGGGLVEAVKKFQKDNHLVVDAIVGNNTWITLFGTGTKSGSDTKVTIREAKYTDGKTKNIYNLFVQEILKSYGYYTMTLDWVFGNGTKSGIKTYQEKKGLKVTGIADVATIKKMFGGL